MKYAVEYALKAPMGGVKLTGGRLKKAFDNNVSFLKGFDVDRMLYWYPASSSPNVIHARV